MIPLPVSEADVWAALSRIIDPELDCHIVALGLIYESDTRRGLFVWNISAPEVRGPVVMLDHLNPQTNHVSL